MNSGDYTDYNMQCQLDIIPITAYFNEEGVANIISMGALSDLYRVTQDTSISQTINVHLPNGTIILFKKCTRRLYYFDTEEKDNLEASYAYPNDNKVEFFSTVASNKKVFYNERN